MKCFACDKKFAFSVSLNSNAARYEAHCIDDQRVIVGSECWKKIKAAGIDGYQPAKGGPRLYTLSNKNIVPKTQGGIP